MLLQKGIQQLKTNQFAPQQQQEVSQFTKNNNNNDIKKNTHKNPAIIQRL